MLFSLLKHYLDTDSALKVSRSVYCFTTTVSHGVENYLPSLWGTGISDAIFAFTASCAIFIGECTKLYQSMILLCQKGYKEMSLETISCI